MIPMMQRASASFDYFYGLADAAYDAAGIRAMSERLGHAPLFDDFSVCPSLPFRKETALDCLPMASKAVFLVFFGFLTHVLSFQAALNAA